MERFKARIKIPNQAKKGEIFQIKTLASHRMENGQRKDKRTGKLIPRMIINKFTCKYNGKTVFSSDWHTAISANPFLAFYVKAEESGTLELSWTDENGRVAKKSRKLKVTS